MISKEKEIKLLKIGSYNGVLADLLRTILIRRGVTTEHKLEHIIAMNLSRELITGKKLTSKKIITCSPSAIKKEVLGESVTFKNLLTNLKRLFDVVHIEFNITTTNSVGTKQEYKFDTNI